MNCHARIGANLVRGGWRQLPILVITAMVGLALVSQSAKAESNSLHMINLADSASTYKALFANTPIEPEFMLVPKFAIIGMENKFVFSTGASLKFTACYDWGNPVRDPNGMGIADIKPAWGSERHLYQMSAGGSGIYFNIIGFPNTAKQIGLFISIGVDADSDNSYLLSAGQVYMRYRNLQCGYANSLYNDRGADAYTIDAHGPCASGAYNTVGFNWQNFVTRHLRLGIGVESPCVSYTQIVPKDLVTDDGPGIPTTSPQSYPDIPMYIGYAWSGGHVRLSYVYRSIHTSNYYTDRSEEHSGWGLKLTGKADIGPVNLNWMVQGGRAIASYFKDGSGGGLDLVPNDHDSHELSATHTWGFITGMTYRFSPKVFATAQCSYMRNYIPYYASPASTTYNHQMRRGFSTIANVVWKISPLFSAGVEYRYGCRTNESRLSLSDNRIYAMMLMNF